MKGLIDLSPNEQKIVDCLLNNPDLKIHIDITPSCCNGPITFSTTVYKIEDNVVTISIYNDYDIYDICEKVYIGKSLHINKNLEKFCPDNETWIQANITTYVKSEVDYIHGYRGKTECFMWWLSDEIRWDALKTLTPTYTLNFGKNN